MIVVLQLENFGRYSVVDRTRKENVHLISTIAIDTYQPDKIKAYMRRNRYLELEHFRIIVSEISISHQKRSVCRRHDVGRLSRETLPVINGINGRSNVTTRRCGPGLESASALTR